jgi:hypothetical protein
VELYLCVRTRLLGVTVTVYVSSTKLSVSEDHRAPDDS